ncbi:hypothetical protein [Idiomarina xiamenensis]|uniref:Uncharacterized protein n=1 Tax=Idiomarina xiamenensis 10-D-4 TaxID=740709 RepID=K2KCK7_9GAMM|nr:hypothetical protein [Idiomarina xiamenensis]EKE84402.1 hypothetical protein A10D4_05022 [Idiomarina xiamenensis 10-D-4]
MSNANNAASSSSAQELIQPHINQSVAQAVQSAADLLRNLNTIETTVIGVASASWLANPAMVEYKQIIESATETITFAAENLAKVGQAGAQVLQDLKPD